MRYDKLTYVNFDRFCYTVTKNVEKCIRVSTATETTIKIIGFIALIFFHLGVIVFLMLCGLLFAGAVAYYGGIGALFAAHPILAAIMLGIMAASGFGMAGSVKKVYANKEIFKVIKERMVSKYKPRFNSSIAATGSTIDKVHPDHEREVNILVSQATVEVISGLIKKTGLGASDILMGPFSKIIRSDIEEGQESFESGLGADALDFLKEAFS